MNDFNTIDGILKAMIEDIDSTKQFAIENHLYDDSDMFLVMLYIRHGQSMKDKIELLRQRIGLK